MKQATTKIVVLLLALGPVGSNSQDLGDEVFTARELAITEAIRLEQIENGPYSEVLIEKYTDLSLLYEEAGDIEPARAAIDRALQLIRANYGLDSLEQVPAIRQLMAYEEQAGNAQAVWNFEQELIGYADRHLDDLRSADIYRAAADRRISVLQRYDAGEYPEEITLGCYYDGRGAYSERFRAGARPITVLSGRGNDSGTTRQCRSGSRNRARKALRNEAQGLYERAASILLSNEEHSSAEIEAVLETLVETSFRYGPRPLGREILLRLVTYANENFEEVLPRVEAMVQLADWEIILASTFGKEMSDMALETYREAYDLLRDHMPNAESVESIFSPEIPVFLPAFSSNPLAPPEGAESATSYIDVSFVVTNSGETDQIEVLQSTDDVSRADEKDLVKLIKWSRFRPRVVDGQFAEASTVNVRYFHKDR